MTEKLDFDTFLASLGLLIRQVDALRLDADRQIEPKQRSVLGQFITPPDVSRLMAGVFEARGGHIRVLHP